MKTWNAHLKFLKIMNVNCNAPVIGNPGACDSRSIVGLNCHDLTSIVPAVPWNNSGFDSMPNLALKVLHLPAGFCGSIQFILTHSKPCIHAFELSRNPLCRKSFVNSEKYCQILFL